MGGWEFSGGEFSVRGNYPGGIIRGGKGGILSVLTENRESYHFEPRVNLYSWLAKTEIALSTPDVAGIYVLWNYSKFL